jgi:hypothetical protein
MSIEKKKPTKEFYSALDEVITHQIKSREAFDRAIEIARKQNFDDFEIGLLIKDYLKDKIPKTSLYRYLKGINPNPVPMEQIYYNNVLEQKEAGYNDLEYRSHIAEARHAIEVDAINCLKMAKILEKMGIPKDKISHKIKDSLKAKGIDKAELIFVDFALQNSEYKDPSVPKADYLQEYINSILPRKHGGYVDDDEWEKEQKTS